MSAALRLMTADEFLTWCLDQEGKWELVDGVPIQMMAGASNFHDVVVVNLIGMLRERLRRGPCRAATADTAARMPRGNIRRPDVTVECAPPERNAFESRAPTVFFEVLSPSSHVYDLVKKPEEYKSVPTLRHFVVLDPAAPRATVWSRDGETWTSEEQTGLDAALDLPAIGASLPLAEIYEGLNFEESAT